MSGAFMTRSIRSLALAAMVAVPAVVQAASIPTGGTGSAAEARRQLSSYFANIKENSPTVLGGLAKSPDVMAAIQKKIASMSEQELLHYQKMMAVTPDWKLAPEAVVQAFPPEVLSHIKKVGADFVAESPEGKAMRDDVRTLVAVLKVMPDEKLAKLGVNREMVASLNATFEEMTPLQAAMLHRQATEGRPWDATSAAAMKSMPAAVRRGALALAEHGPLTDKDIAGLGQFRGELTRLFDRIDKLPPETRKSLDTDALRKQMNQLGQASPDLLFMIRHNVPEEMVTSLAENVKFLERISNLSDSDKKDLEQFRSELSSALEPLEKNATLPEGARSIEQSLESLSPQELVLLKQGMARFGEWRTALPAVYGALGSPDLRDRMVALEGPSANLDQIAALESFRRQTLAELASSFGTADVDAAMLDNARKGLETAPVQNLELMRAALNQLPANATGKQRLAVVSLAGPPISFNCNIDMPSPVPDINLAFICNPIASALTTIRDGIESTVNTIVNGVRDALNASIAAVQGALNTAINAVTSVVNDIVSGLTSLVDQIVTFVLSVPQKAWDLIKSALDALLNIPIKNGVTIGDLVNSGVEHALESMKTLLGLAPGWWTAISTFQLPVIPCPPPNFPTPFGPVGDSEASNNYARYRLIVAGLVGLIPDTEISLKVKIPAQILFMAFDFLGLCLEQAAATADDILAASRHNIVMANFAGLQAHVAVEVGGLSTTQGKQVTTILNKVNTESLNVRSKVTNESLAIQAVLVAESTTIQNVVDREATEIKSLIQAESDATQAGIKDFRTLALRLIIEKTLRAGNNHEIAHLQMLEPAGHLRLVSDIVRETINNTKAAGEPVGKAEEDYAKGATAMNAGKEKEAFKLFTKAYQQAASKTGSGTD